MATNEEKIASALEGLLTVTKNINLQYDIPEFTFEKGDMDYKAWLKHVEYVAELNNWGARHALMILKTKCKKRAKTKIQDLDEYVDRPLRELLDAVREKFKGKRTTLLTFLETTSLVMKEDESQEQWAHRVKTTANRAGTEEKMLPLGVFVQGQRNPRVREKLYEMTDINDLKTALEKALVIDQGIKATKQDAINKGATAADKNDAGTSQQATPWHLQAPEPMEIEALRRFSTCYKCGVRGHFARECKGKASLPTTTTKHKGASANKWKSSGAQKGGKMERGGDRRKWSETSRSKRKETRRYIRELLNETSSDSEEDEEEQNNVDQLQEKQEQSSSGEEDF